MSNIPTPHINAKEGDFAKTVLMPGDPLRAKYIADHYLENAQLVNNVRVVHGYTGQYKGKRVSVMASGMGMPSIGIYSYELYNYYGVENIIRVGSAGAMSDKLKLRDIVAGMSAYTTSNYGYQFGFDGTLAPCCSYELLTKAVEAAKKAAAKKAIEEARKRGAVGELVPEVRVNRTMVRDEQSGRNLPIGTVVEAEITQRA